MNEKEKRTRCTAKRISQLADLADCSVFQGNGRFTVRSKQACEEDHCSWTETMKTRREVMAFLRGFIRGRSQVRLEEGSDGDSE